MGGLRIHSIARDSIVSRATAGPVVIPFPRMPVSLGPEESTPASARDYGIAENVSRLSPLPTARDGRDPKDLG